MDSTRKVVKGTLRDRYLTLNGRAVKEIQLLRSTAVRRCKQADRPPFVDSD